MKTLNFLLLLLIFTLPSIAQQTFSHWNDIKPTIKGQLIGYDTEEHAALEIKLVAVVPTPDGQKTYYATVEKDGSFNFQMEYPLRYQQIWFSIGDYYYGQLIVDKGLVIEADLNKLEEKNRANFQSKHVKFSGADGALTAYVNQYTRYAVPKRKGYPAWTDIIRDNTISVQEKSRQLKNTFDAILALAESFIAKYPSPHEWAIINEIKTEVYGLQFLVHWNEKMPSALEQEALAHQPKLISNSSIFSYYGYLSTYFMRYDQAVEKLKFLQDELMPLVAENSVERDRLEAFIELQKNSTSLDSVNFALFRKEQRYFSKQYKVAFDDSSFKRVLHKVAQLDDSEKEDMVLLVGDLRDIWRRAQYTELVLPALESEQAKTFMEQSFKAIEAKMKATEKRLADIQISSINTPIGKSIGVLESGAKLMRTSHSSVDSLIASIRATYPEKAILLDVWATWCGPCLHDMENSTANLKKLEAMDVVVVYLCTTHGTTERAWKKKVAEINLNAPQVYLNEAVSKNIIAYFDLKGYPSHILLDKNGKYQPEFHTHIQHIDFVELEEMLATDK